MSNYQSNNQNGNDMSTQNAGGVRKRIKCPSCGGIHLQYTTETETKVETSGGGYSGSKGCLGYLLLGPFGLLCGNCGQSQKTTVTDVHKHFWVCSDCGCKFPTLEDLEAELIQKKNALKWYPPMLVSCAILLAMGIGLHITLLTVLGILVLVLIAALRPLLKKEIQTKEAEYAELEEKIRM